MRLPIKLTKNRLPRWLHDWLPSRGIRNNAFRQQSTDDWDRRSQAFIICVVESEPTPI